MAKTNETTGNFSDDRLHGMSVIQDIALNHMAPNRRTTSLNYGLATVNLIKHDAPLTVTDYVLEEAKSSLSARYIIPKDAVILNVNTTFSGSTINAFTVTYSINDVVEIMHIDKYISNAKPFAMELTFTKTLYSLSQGDIIKEDAFLAHTSGIHTDEYGTVKGSSHFDGRNLIAVYGDFLDVEEDAIVFTESGAKKFEYNREYLYSPKIPKKSTLLLIHKYVDESGNDKVTGLPPYGKVNNDLILAYRDNVAIYGSDEDSKDKLLFSNIFNTDEYVQTPFDGLDSKLHIKSHTEEVVDIEVLLNSNASNGYNEEIVNATKATSEKDKDRALPVMVYGDKMSLESKAYSVKLLTKGIYSRGSLSGSSLRDVAVINIKTISKTQVGASNKFTTIGASKGVNSVIIPDEEAPRFANGIVADVILPQLAIVNRGIYADKYAPDLNGLVLETNIKYNKMKESDPKSAYEFMYKFLELANGKEFADEWLKNKDKPGMVRLNRTSETNPTLYETMKTLKENGYELDKQDMEITVNGRRETIKDCRISVQHIRLLNKIGEMLPSANITYNNVHGLPIKGSNAEGEPVNIKGPSTYSESEGRTSSASCDPDMWVSTVDLASNPDTIYKYLQNTIDAKGKLVSPTNNDTTVRSIGTNLVTPVMNAFGKGIQYHVSDDTEIKEPYKHKDYRKPNRPLTSEIIKEHTIELKDSDEIIGYEVTYSDEIKSVLTPYEYEMAMYCYEQFTIDIASDRCISKYLNDGRVTATTPIELVDSLVRDVSISEHPEDIGLVRNNHGLFMSNIYSNIELEAEKYMQQLTTYDIIEAQEHPIIKKSMQTFKEDPSEKNVADLNKAVDTAMKDLGGTNAVARAYVNGSVKVHQVQQSFGALGYMQDNSGTIYKRPIIGNYVQGLQGDDETGDGAIIQSIDMAKTSLANTDDGIRKSEYKSRQVQLNALSFGPVTSDDCGTEERFKLTLDREDIDYNALLDGMWVSESENGNDIMMGKHDAMKYFGKALYIRTPINCKHQTPCKKCLGSGGNSIHPRHRIGLYYIDMFTEEYNQKTLSTKHALFSAIAIRYLLPPVADEELDILTIDEDDTVIFDADKVDGKEYYVEVHSSYVDLARLESYSVATASLASFTNIRGNVNIVIAPKGKIIDAIKVRSFSLGKNKASLTRPLVKKLHKFITTHKADISTGEATSKDGKFVFRDNLYYIALNGTATHSDVKLMVVNNIGSNMSKYIDDTYKTLNRSDNTSESKSDIIVRDDPALVLEDVINVVHSNKSSKMNIVVLAMVVRALSVKDVDNNDYRLPTSDDKNQSTLGYIKLLNSKTQLSRIAINGSTLLSLDDNISDDTQMDAMLDVHGYKMSTNLDYREKHMSEYLSRCEY